MSGLIVTEVNRVLSWPYFQSPAGWITGPTIGNDTQQCIGL